MAIKDKEILIMKLEWDFEMKTCFVICVVLVLCFVSFGCINVQENNEPSINEKDHALATKLFAEIIHPNGTEVKALYRNMDTDCWIFKYTMPEDEAINAINYARDNLLKKNYTITYNSTTTLWLENISANGEFDFLPINLNEYRIALGSDKTTIYIGWLQCDSQDEYDSFISKFTEKYNLYTKA